MYMLYFLDQVRLIEQLKKNRLCGSINLSLVPFIKGHSELYNYNDIHICFKQGLGNTYALLILVLSKGLKKYEFYYQV